VNGKLYVGGNFTMADSSVTANSIAYVTETGGNYTWHNLGSGVNGIVYAIAEYDNKIFVGGTFTQAGSTQVNNVAYWDGTAWHDAGVAGKVNDLIVYNNELYAAGQFDIMGGLIDVNFAKWNGTAWLPYSGLIGHINTMEVVDNDLLLGGDFIYGIAAKNIIKWNVANGFQPFGNSIENEVNDIEKFGDTVYAVCTRTAANDSALINKLKNNTWEDAAPGLMMFQFPPDPNRSFKTLCAHVDTFMVAGDFFLSPMVGNYAQNTYSFINPIGVANWINVDSAVNKMTVFNGELIAAGKFQYGNAGFGWGNVKLNHITRKSYHNPTSVGTISKDNHAITIYPNPASSSGTLILENGFHADKVMIIDISGKEVASYNIKDKKETITLPQLATGNYVIETFNANGEKATQKLMIK
ncbi:MAG TPA: T9SS type A sorting domain-containing protein, partial [Flavipsychrobacter sp.]|nr:T9SS type A sorting domain-containing protein [Flavipsychrobacter sp.]